MLKDIIVNLTVDAANDVAADYAISVGRTFEAHLAGISFAYEPVIPGSVFGSMAVELIQTQRAEFERAARKAIAHFEDAARRVNLAAESRLQTASLAEAAGMFGALARRFDLSVVAQAEPNKLPGRELIIEAALFESGRPVLVVPYIQRDGLKLDHVTVCWDGSRNAARAVADAIPIIGSSGRVEVVIVTNERGKEDEIEGADIGQHLARHGLKVDVHRISGGDIDVADALLSHAADSGADFMVMGGYGHSRLREFILGGVTRSIFESMTVPVLMSH